MVDPSPPLFSQPTLLVGLATELSHCSDARGGEGGNAGAVVAGAPAQHADALLSQQAASKDAKAGCGVKRLRSPPTLPTVTGLTAPPLPTATRRRLAPSRGSSVAAEDGAAGRTTPTVSPLHRSSAVDSTASQPRAASRGDSSKGSVVHDVAAAAAAAAPAAAAAAAGTAAEPSAGSATVRLPARKTRASGQARPEGPVALLRLLPVIPEMT